MLLRRGTSGIPCWACCPPDQATDTWQKMEGGLEVLRDKRDKQIKRTFYFKIEMRQRRILVYIKVYPTHLNTKQD